MNSVDRATVQRIAYLDGWRALAILSVFMGHFAALRMMNVGRFGVELFFVLSGRLMAEILFVKKTPLTQFFPRRFTRVYPALLFFVLAVSLVSPLIGEAVSFKQMASVLTFTYNYLNPLVGRVPILDHIWSLCIEEHIYIFLGILAFLLRDRPIVAASICLAVAAMATLNGALMTRGGLDYYQVYWRTDVRGASILYGAAAYLFLNMKWVPQSGIGFLPILLGAAGFALNLGFVPDPIKYSLGTLCLASSMALLNRASPFVLKLLENPVLLRVGIWSYSLYLWQQPFAKVGGGALHHLMFLPAAVGCALFSFYLVEKPARAGLNRWLRQ